MRLKSSILYALSAASSALALRTCGTPSPTEEQNEIAHAFMLREEGARLAGNTSRAAPITISIYWHVLASSQSASGGYLTQKNLDDQLDVLNTAYAPHDISFVSEGADWTVNSNWANDGSELTMKKTLRKGTYADLNIYFVPNMFYLGYAYLPDTVSPGSDDFYYDGVSILSTTIPGGSEQFYNLGHTATHEVGHWLGLYHTFEGYSCSGNGDYVSDTAFESEEAYGCEIGRDTCPSQPGDDPVTNYMDYSDDECFTGFTAGQEARIYSYWEDFRASYQ